MHVMHDGALVLLFFTLNAEKVDQGFVENGLAWLAELGQSHLHL